MALRPLPTISFDVRNVKTVNIMTMAITAMNAAATMPQTLSEHLMQVYPGPVV